MVFFRIFIKNNEGETVEHKIYEYSGTTKIIDIKKELLNDIFNNKFNYLNLENITERVYKDYGKLFFDKGLLPETIDNYKLLEFTNEDRTFLFLALPQNVEVQQIKKINSEDNFLKKIIKEERKKGNNNEFKYFEDDFPPLG
jgi:hypothetical protein